MRYDGFFFGDPPITPDEGDIQGHVRQMARLGEWGDDLMLRALSRAFNVKIRVLKRLDMGYEWFDMGEGE